MCKRSFTSFGNGNKEHTYVIFGYFSLLQNIFKDPIFLSSIWTFIFSLSLLLLTLRISFVLIHPQRKTLLNTDSRLLSSVFTCSLPTLQNVLWFVHEKIIHSTSLSHPSWNLCINLFIYAKKQQGWQKTTLYHSSFYLEPLIFISSTDYAKKQNSCEFIFLILFPCTSTTYFWNRMRSFCRFIKATFTSVILSCLQNNLS